MSRVSTYLTFMPTGEDAFNFYSSVFGTEINSDTTRMGDMPNESGSPELTAVEQKLVAA